MIIIGNDTLIYSKSMEIINFLFLNKGSMSTSECSMNYLIPIWLVVGGCGGIVSEFFASAILIYSFFRAFHHRSFTEKIIHIFLFVVPFVLIVVFNLAWFFTGNYNSL